MIKIQVLGHVDTMLLNYLMILIDFRGLNYHKTEKTSMFIIPLLKYAYIKVIR